MRSREVKVALGILALGDPCSLSPPNMDVTSVTLPRVGSGWVGHNPKPAGAEGTFGYHTQG